MIDAVYTGPLGDINVGLTAATAVMVPMTAQLDALLSVGLGPYQADLAAQLNATLAGQATLILDIGDPLAALRAAIAAVAQLQASLTAALQFPPINLTISAEIAASAALVGSLTARLGLLTAALRAAAAVKFEALELVGDLQTHLGAGPVVAVAFSGDTWAATGGKLASLLSGGTEDGHSIPGLVPSGLVAGGVLMLTGDASAALSLGAIIRLP